MKSYVKPTTYTMLQKLLFVLFVFTNNKFSYMGFPYIYTYIFIVY